jgi:hypothetical protein
MTNNAIINKFFAALGKLPDHDLVMLGQLLDDAQARIVLRETITNMLSLRDKSQRFTKRNLSSVATS